MKTVTNTHLSDDQFSDLLLGSASDECRGHLAVCSACRAEAGKFTDSVELFSTSSLAWTDARPGGSHRATVVAQRHRATVAPLRWAFAAVALMLVALPVWNHSHHVVRVPSAGMTTATEDSPAEIAQDNQLMQSINVALNTEDASPLREYRLHASPRARTVARIP